MGSDSGNFIGTVFFTAGIIAIFCLLMARMLRNKFSGLQLISVSVISSTVLATLLFVVITLLDEMPLRTDGYTLMVMLVSAGIVFGGWTFLSKRPSNG